MHSVHDPSQENSSDFETESEHTISDESSNSYISDLEPAKKPPKKQPSLNGKTKGGFKPPLLPKNKSKVVLSHSESGSWESCDSSDSSESGDDSSEESHYTGKLTS